MRSLGLGLIGCGEVVFRETAPAIQAAGNAHLVRVMDIDVGRAASVGNDWGVPHTTSLDEVLADSKVDAVVVSTPHHLHVEQTLLACRAGRHVICEKPLATSLEDADAMIAACRNAKVQLGVALCSRYRDNAIQARALVQEGAIGQVIGIHLSLIGYKAESYWTGGYSERGHSTWRLSKAKAGGGVLMMNLLHDIDRLCWITQCVPRRVSGELDTFCTDVDVEDYVSATLRFDNGAIGTLNATSCAVGRRGDGHRIVGTRGQIVFPDHHSLRVYLAEGTREYPAEEWTEVRSTAGPSPRQVFIERFAEAVSSGTDVDISGVDGRQCLQVVLATYESARQGTAIEIPIPLTSVPSVDVIATRGGDSYVKT